jgi:hypothetical protein
VPLEVTIGVMTVGVISVKQPRVLGRAALHRQVADTIFLRPADVPVDRPACPAAAVGEVVGDRGEIPGSPRTTSVFVSMDGDHCARLVDAGREGLFGIRATHGGYASGRGP